MITWTKLSKQLKVARSNLAGRTIKMFLSGNAEIIIFYHNMFLNITLQIAS
jgi:hypothetical protein